MNYATSWDFTLANYGPVWSFLVQMGLLLLFLMAGNILRRTIPLFRKCLIPSALLGGAVLFFSLFSGILRPILRFWVELSLFPLHLGNIFIKKLHIFCKKVFSFLWKWFTIMVTPHLTGEEREHGAQTVQTEDAPQQ